MHDFPTGPQQQQADAEEGCYRPNWCHLHVLQTQRNAHPRTLEDQGHHTQCKEHAKTFTQYDFSFQVKYGHCLLCQWIH